MRTPPAVARRREGVFTSREALEAGWTRTALEHAVRRGGLVKLQRGVWADATGTTDLTSVAAADRLLTQRSIAAALSTRAGIVSHLAAARRHELPVWAPMPRPCVTVTHRDRAGLGHVHTHRSAVDRVHLRDGVACTTVVRTILDVTREFGVESGLVTADAALAGQLLRRSDLVTAVAALRPSPGTRQLADLVRLVDERSESPLESRSRWHLDRVGVDAPLSQRVLRRRDGTFLGRVDFFWDDGVVGEVDGNVKYRRRPVRDEDDERIREKWRQERLERAGLLVVRWGVKDFADFETVARLLADRRARVRRPGWPRDWVASAS